MADFYGSAQAPAVRPLDAIAQAAPGVPVVLTTTEAWAAELDPHAVGVAGIVVKPCSVDDLLGRVTAALASRRRRLDRTRSTMAHAEQRLAASGAQAAASADLLRRLGL